MCTCCFKCSYISNGLCLQDIVTLLPVPHAPAVTDENDMKQAWRFLQVYDFLIFTFAGPSGVPEAEGEQEVHHCELLWLCPQD